MTTRHFQNGRQAPTAGSSARVSAGHLLVVLRRHHISCSIDAFSTDGWTARLGEPGRGPYSQQGCFDTRQAAAEWLLQEVERRGAECQLFGS
jgi:hypothetical protein